MLGEAEQLVGVMLHVNAAAVEDDGGGFDAGGELDGLKGVAVGQFALASPFGGELVEVGGGITHAEGERAEVVEAGNANFAGVHGFEDAGEEADAGIVAQFSAREAEVADFAEHGTTVGVAMGVPTGGERVHGTQGMGGVMD